MIKMGPGLRRVDDSGSDASIIRINIHCMTHNLDIEATPIAIIGGGLVGGSVAIALASRGRKVALIEATDAVHQQPASFDERNLALAAASIEALTSLGVLRHLATAPCPVQQIHVSRAGDFGSLRINAHDHGRDQLGAVVIARELGAALEARIRELPLITRLRPQRFVGVSALDDALQIELIDASAASNPRQLTTPLLLACDGSDSAVRAALGIATDDHDYAQELFVCALRAERPHVGIAYERFTDAGPLALLPRADGSYGAVCGVPAADADALFALSDAAWCSELQQRFGGRVGRFLHTGVRSRYAIRSRVAQRLTARRCALLGNAAQTLHPIGAQGFNLGLRDALTLADVVGAADDPGADGVLAEYAARRQSDRAQTLAFSDGLARLTAGQSFPHHVLRSLGMLALAHAPGLRAPLVSGAMGYRGRALSEGGR